ncbi:MAG: yedI [Alphaproteobacteria bacterium]|jgi:predicted DNA repair protein MutK|nr:yedI [Alphaproteobacteria bacterium]
MAFGGLLALLDDITLLLDDVAAMSKVAATKTAGIAGDDLAVNAQALVGIDPKRELPIVWRVAKGSFKNKLILIPAALILSIIAEWAIVPLLMFGGAFLCYEGAEKVIHALKPTAEDVAHANDLRKAAQKSAEELLEVEKSKISEAVNTDFILSAEIVAVALGAVKEKTIWVQAGVLTGVGIGMTVFVYGLVACIIKLDDVGMYFAKSTKKVVQKLGIGILKFVPYLMKTLSVVGTAAMFSVGGGIVLHGIPAAEHAMHDLNTFVSILISTVAGLLIGLAIVPVWHQLEKPLAKLKAKLSARKTAKA